MDNIVEFVGNLFLVAVGIVFIAVVIWIILGIFYCVGAVILLLIGHDITYWFSVGVGFGTFILVNLFSG